MRAFPCDVPTNHFRGRTDGNAVFGSLAFQDAAKSQHRAIANRRSTQYGGALRKPHVVADVDAPCRVGPLCCADIKEGTGIGELFETSLPILAGES